MPKTAIDPFFALAQDLVAPARFGLVVTPSDGQDLPYVTKQLIVTIAGGATSPGIAVIFANDPDFSPVFIPLTAGQTYVLDLQVRRVMAAGTSLGATGGVIALWGG